MRIDTIEQGLSDLRAIDVEGEGYWLAYRIAAMHNGSMCCMVLCPTDVGCATSTER